jgi:hypothetical protein
VRVPRPWRRVEQRPDPHGAVLMLAECAVQIRNTPNISNDALLWQLNRARVFLNWIDEKGGWDDELRGQFTS